MQKDVNWDSGLNNVIFNFHPPISSKTGVATGFNDLPIGRSLIASSSLRHSTIRFGMDVPIPYYSKLGASNYIKVSLAPFFDFAS